MASHRQVGHFEVLEPLGAGGMGEVFKARDQRLNRLVALKFLPDAALGAARDRFEREALAIAALNHPHICTLYEVGSEDGRPYLVLELLEGETLRARLKRGPVSTEQWLDWSAQVADALDAAHRKGVIHRDLKPDNIWISSGGHVKVLDFGLARLETEQALSADARTMSQPLTSPGVTMGTIPYMSPEQARGEALDARSDLFSLGSVLYEMATGRAAFTSRTPAECMAAILKEQPPRATQLRPDLPPRLEEVTTRCLEKDPDLRYQSAADLRGDLKRLKRESGSTAALPAAAAPPQRRYGWIGAATAVVLVVVAAGVTWWRWRPHVTAPTPQLQFHQLTFNGNVVDSVISPDGKFLAHVDTGPAGTSLHLLSIGNGGVGGSDAEIMPPTEGCCQSPSFSPDGSQIYFLENRRLMAIPLLGGTARTIVASACSGAGFSPDGSQMAYVVDRGAIIELVLAHPDDSQAHSVHSAANGAGYLSQCWGNPGQPTHSPSWSPDGTQIAVMLGAQGQTEAVEVVSAEDGHAVDLNIPGSGQDVDLSWLPDGSGIIFTHSIPAGAASQVWEVSYPGGKITQLTTDLQGYSSASVSQHGQLALVHAAPQYSVWTQAAAAGAFRQLPGGGATLDGVNGLAWTPQSSLLSLRSLGGAPQLWAENPDGSSAHVLTASGLPSGFLALYGAAADGSILLNGAHGSNEIFVVPADGTGIAPLFQPGPGAQALYPAVVADGQIAYLYADAKNNQTLWAMPLHGGAAHQISSRFVYVDGNPASPDGTQIFAIVRGADPTSHVPAIFHLQGAGATVTPIGLDFKTMPPPYGWTADGRGIVYVKNQGTTDNLWAYPVAGGAPYALTHFNDLRIASFALARDGRLAISRGSPNSDTVVAVGLGGH